MNNNDKQYSKDYRPNVCIADYTIKYFPSKYEKLLLGTAEEKKYASKYVESLHIFKESILLNDDSQFVNEELKLSHLKRVLPRYGVKYNENNTYVLRNLKIHHFSKAMYTVNQEE